MKNYNKLDLSLTFIIAFLVFIATQIVDRNIDYMIYSLICLVSIIYIIVLFLNLKQKFKNGEIRKETMIVILLICAISVTLLACYLFFGRGL